jgi:hypothetical protein
VPTEPGQSREEFAAELLARFGIDPDRPEHKAATERARASIRHTGSRTRQGTA